MALERALEWAASAPPKILARHTQNFSDAAELQPHWGYLDRALPCTSGAAVCAYLDIVYSAHDRGMIYVAVFWLVVASILFLWALLRYCHRPQISKPLPSAKDEEKVGLLAPNAPVRTLQRYRNTASVAFRSYLLPNCKQTYFFNHVTRAQVVVLAMLVAYMIVFSFVGMSYRSWSVPVKGSKKNTIRSSLGPFSDRVGVLAFALTPLSILLASRESLLSVLTGLPYHHFNFLHRWVGHIIFMQSAIHTIGWCIIEIRLYQPQPTKALQLVQETYLIWGIVAMSALLLLWLLSTPWARRRFGYEFFRKAHYILAMLFIGACWGHWEQLKVFLLPSLLLWGADRALRLLRTAFIHYGLLEDGTVGFSIIRSSSYVFQDPNHGDVVRLDFDLPCSGNAWNVGQHYFLTFAQTSIWQSHPFTPLSTPALRNGVVRHSYVLRAKAGETRKLALALGKKQSAADTTGVILSGPYGSDILAPAQASLANVLCIAGGTGVTFTLPVLTMLASDPSSVDRKIQLVWAIKREQDIMWIQDELLALRRLSPSISICIFVTDAQHVANTTTLKQNGQVEAPSSPASSDRDSSLSRNEQLDEKTASDILPELAQLISGYSRPALDQLVPRFLEEVSSGASKVYVSGPQSMSIQARSLVACANRPSELLKGNSTSDVELITDERFD